MFLIEMIQEKKTRNELGRIRCLANESEAFYSKREFLKKMEKKSLLMLIAHCPLAN